MTFTNQESLVWNIIEFDNENISTTPSLVNFSYKFGYTFFTLFLSILYSWLKADKYLDLSCIFIIKSCSCTVLMPRHIWHFQWVTWSFCVSYWWQVIAERLALFFFKNYVLQIEAVFFIFFIYLTFICNLVKICL